jgi:hypothetical protein
LYFRRWPNLNNEQRRVLKIDKQAILDFAQICKKHGVQHFDIVFSGYKRRFFELLFENQGELVKSGKAATSIV